MRIALVLTFFFMGSLTAQKASSKRQVHVTPPSVVKDDGVAKIENGPGVVVPPAITLSDSVLEVRPISAEVLNAKFKAGPLENKGQVIIDAAKLHGVDPLFLASLFAYETGWGVSRSVKKNNNPAKIPERDSAGQEKRNADGVIVLKEFATIEEGIAAGAEHIKAIATSNPVPTNPKSILSVTNSIFPEKDAARIKREDHQKAVLNVMNFLTRMEAYK